MDLFYREIGEPGNQPLVILHGVFGSCDNWLTLGKRFAEHYHVFLVDHRNHGRSPHSDEFSYEIMKEDLKDFILAHGLENPIIIGHSMGGKVSMLFAMQYPELYEKLVVVDIAPKAYPPHHDSILRGLQAIPLESLSNRNEADEILSRYEPDLGVRQFLLKNLYKEGNAFAWRINLPVLAREMLRLGIEIKGEASHHPTLFVRGLKSKYVQDGDWAHIKSLFPQAELLSFPEAGHWVQAEVPDAFYEGVMKFLR